MADGKLYWAPFTGEPENQPEEDEKIYWEDSAEESAELLWEDTPFFDEPPFQDEAYVLTEDAKIVTTLNDNHVILNFAQFIDIVEQVKSAIFINTDELIKEGQRIPSVEYIRDAEPRDILYTSETVKNRQQINASEDIIAQHFLMSYEIVKSSAQVEASEDIRAQQLLETSEYIYLGETKKIDTSELILASIPGTILATEKVIQRVLLETTEKIKEKVVLEVNEKVEREGQSKLEAIEEVRAPYVAPPGYLKLIEDRNLYIKPMLLEHVWDTKKSRGSVALNTYVESYNLLKLSFRNYLGIIINGIFYENYLGKGPEEFQLPRNVPLIVRNQEELLGFFKPDPEGQLKMELNGEPIMRMELLDPVGDSNAFIAREETRVFDLPWEDRTTAPVRAGYDPVKNKLEVLNIDLQEDDKVCILAGIPSPKQKQISCMVVEFRKLDKIKNKIKVPEQGVFVVKNEKRILSKIQPSIGSIIPPKTGALSITRGRERKQAKKKLSYNPDRIYRLEGQSRLIVRKELQSYLNYPVLNSEDKSVINNQEKEKYISGDTQDETEHGLVLEEVKEKTDKYYREVFYLPELKVHELVGLNINGIMYCHPDHVEFDTENSLLIFKAFKIKPEDKIYIIYNIEENDKKSLGDIRFATNHFPVLECHPDGNKFFKVKGGV